MDVTNDKFSSTHSAERSRAFDNKDLTKVKSTKEIQQQVQEQAVVEKIKKEEVKKVDDSRDRKEIEQELTQLAEKLNDEIAPLTNDIRFGYSDEIEQMLVNIIDTNTGSVIRQFPSEEAIDIMTKMKELIGMLFDKKG